jgi:uncharacterized membrane protein YphA (DoxX/SURF4 family)
MRRPLERSRTTDWPGLKDLAALVGRLLLALIFVVEGWIKIVSYSGTVGYMEAYGVPGALLLLGSSTATSPTLTSSSISSGTWR